MTSGRSRWRASPYSASATSSATARMRGTPSVAPDGDSTAPPVEASEGREPFQWTRPRYEHGARMTTPMMIRAEANNEFEAASRDPFLSDLTAILTRRERRLLPLDDAVRAARRDGQVDRGVREIPLDRIRGSESRTTDFDASFHPLKEHLRQRWTRLYMLVQDSREMPPIDVYQVDDVYFVKDGHHRVSRPVMEVAERHRVADQLPGWTEADVYLALTRLWLDLDQEGRLAGPEGAVEALLSGEEPHLSRAGLSAHRARRLRRRRRLEREAVAGSGRRRARRLPQVGRGGRRPPARPRGLTPRAGGGRPPPRRVGRGGAPRRRPPR